MTDRRADVLVIGAGVIGVSAAYFLALKGRAVTVLEAGEIASGCSYGNAGLVVPSLSVPLAAPGVVAKGVRWMFKPDSPFYVKFRWDRDLLSWLWKFRASCREETARRSIPVLRDLHRASALLFDELTRLEGMDCAYARRGVLGVFRTEKGFAEGRAEAELLGEFGLASGLLDASSARALVPALRPGLAGAIHYTEDAHLEPAAFVRTLARHAERHRASFVTHTEVLGFRLSGRRIVAVHTPRGDFLPEEVVLASGSWSPALARGLGLRLPIQPAKGYSIGLASPPTPPAVPLLLAEAKVGVTPMGRFLRLAGTLELAGLDFSVNERRVQAIRHGAREYLDGLDSLRELEVWRGLRPCTPDGLPILGRPRTVENLVLATGHAMIGLSLGPVTGKIVTEIVAREQPSFEVGPLAPDRFDS